MRAVRRYRVSFCVVTATAVVLAGFFAKTAIATARGMMPDFALLNVNTTSSTYGQLVSPRDHLWKVSAWYFGHAT